jgi:hypothetical protein
VGGKVEYFLASSSLLLSVDEAEAAAMNDMVNTFFVKVMLCINI